MNPRSEDRKPSTTKRMIIMVVIVGLLLTALIGWNVMGKIMGAKFAANQPVPPQTVSSTIAGEQKWQPEQSSVGSLRAVQGADLAFDVGGIVSKIGVASGQQVKKGELLVELNADEFVAQQRQLEANADLLKTTLARSKQQLGYKGISQAAYDSAAADVKAAQAGINQQRALVAKRQLRAPFDGRIGIVTMTAGSYINAGTAVVTLQQLDPIYVDFNVPQSSLGEMKVGQKLALSVDGFNDRTFDGEVTAISPKLDASTRNAQIEARVANADEALKPGMFADVSIKIGDEKSYITLPQGAITFNPYGETVFLVVKPGEKVPGKDAEQAAAASAKPMSDANKDVDDTKDAKPADDGTNHSDKPTAQSVFVTTGAKRGDQIAVLTGIKVGDQVVTSGQLKIKNGTPLIIDNTHQPANEAAPTPQEK
ncbi:MAG: efflux RND transporter periplasmic adaptor subunit [Dokdonella sp.]